MPYPTEEFPEPREYICDGTHSRKNFKYVEELEVEICSDPVCAKVFAHCIHGPDQNKWNEKGTVLTCTFCGKDVT